MIHFCNTSGRRRRPTDQVLRPYAQDCRLFWERCICTARRHWLHNSIPSFGCWLAFYLAEKRMPWSRSLCYPDESIAIHSRLLLITARSDVRTISNTGDYGIPIFSSCINQTALSVARVVLAALILSDLALQLSVGTIERRPLFYRLFQDPFQFKS